VTSSIGASIKNGRGNSRQKFLFIFFPVPPILKRNHNLLSSFLFERMIVILYTYIMKNNI